MSTHQVAVLFARADSNYKAMPGCDVWDAERDARRWSGGAPVVAHPPCRAWGKLFYFAKPRPGEKDLAPWAVQQVRAHGGVLEHPKDSKLWPAAGLPLPGQVDAWGGWTLPISQHWWGHRAEKMTWLYIVGCAPRDIPPIPLHLGDATHVIAQSRMRRKDGSRLRKGMAGWRPEVSKAEREHTPPNWPRGWSNWRGAAARTEHDEDTVSENSKIEWTDHTFNPWEGCQKVGPGCDHCYAETRNARFAGGTAVNWGPGAPRRRTSAANWRKPLAWNAAHDDFFAQHGRRQRVFCASLADVFDNAVDPTWRVDLLRLIAATPNLDWLLLTKRIGNVHAMLDQALAELSHGLTLWENAPWPNIWIGASIVNQEEADRDIPKLLAVPARVRFLSMEPLLGPVDLSVMACKPCPTSGGELSMDPSTGAYECCSRCDFTGIGDEWGIDWVIAGGESGPGARPMHPAWARDLRDQCAAAGVPFLFKQWGEWLPAVDGRSVLGKTLILEGAAPLPDKPLWHGFEGGQQVARVGKKAAGRQLDGALHDGYPSAKSGTF